MTEDRESEVLVRVFAQVMYNENDHWTADKGLSAVSVIKRKRKPNQTAITKQPSTTAAPVSSTTDNPLEGRFASVEPIHCNEQADNYVNLSDYEYRIVGSCTIDNKFDRCLFDVFYVLQGCSLSLDSIITESRIGHLCPALSYVNFILY
ncbi:uncharacterized protein LOC113373775 [Ctenocephalides felis]|uniref:uncharacterized protein LOC113373775 n=1 Tax=Ctenocephalides felis TaxID=7515 RepID=UPI000E6E2C5E|nr:uncharacterized protein LOC113373775 [Ctenocephalides felis]